MENECSGNLDTLFLLKSVDLFSRLDMACLYQVLKASVYRRFSPNQTIVGQGETGDAMYVLLEGELGVYLDNGKRLINTIKPGETVGELSLFEKRQRTATVKATVESLLLEFKNDDFLALASKNGVLAFSVIKTLAGRLRNVLEQT